jgi:uncharacterized protein (DUF697 family)/tellurite resistance protein
MLTSQQQSILAIALLAAFADGASDREREEIRRIADSLAGEDGSAQLSALYQDVLLKRVDVSKAGAALTDPAHKQLAYEMAVCVCDADGATSPAEQQFLQELRAALQLDPGKAAQVVREADAIAAAPLAAGAGSSPSSMSDAEMDQYILNHAIVNGAIELLPQSLATMAIIPLQMKLVYRIGQSYGYEMDKGHIKEFLATAGVGLTAQYVEQVGRRLLGGLLGAVAGGLGRGLGSVATGAAFSFATTYALGQVARRYYAGGRQMNTALLQQTYQSLLSQAKQLQGQYAGQIHQKAQSLDATQVMNMVKA